MVERLADYEQHPDDYHDGSYREPADEDRADYIAPTLCLLGETAKIDSIFHDLDDARFRAYEQQMEIEREQDASARKNIIIGFCVCLILLVSAFAVWIFRQRSILRRTNQVLVSQIAEAAALQQVQTPKAPLRPLPPHAVHHPARATIP